MKFREWFLIENTVSQTLKSNPDQETVRRIQAFVLKTMLTQMTLTQEQLAPVVKLFTLWILEMQPPKHPGNLTAQAQWDNITIFRTINQFLSGTEDFIHELSAHQAPLAKSKFNSTDYKIDNLLRDSSAWHVKLAKQKRKKANPGRRVEIAGMPAGYYWVCLDKGSCEEEGDAMGHCGNGGGSPGDIVWSMRDPKGIPHLTFIVNDKMLGESKGFGNNKPEAKYHPHIAAFLLGNDSGVNIIDHIKGGGYKPEANFHFKDFDKETQQKVLAVKPYIVDFVGYLVDKFQANAPNLLHELNRAFHTRFERVDLERQILVASKFNSLEKLTDYLGSTMSYIKYLPDLDSIGEKIDVPSDAELKQYYDWYASSSNKKKLETFADTLGLSGIDDYLANSDIKDILKWSSHDGLRNGLEHATIEFLNDVFRDMKDVRDGFRIEEVGHKYQISIPLEKLSKFYYSVDDWDGEDFDNQIKFDYDSHHRKIEPDFDDDAYNDTLEQTLNDITRKTGPQR
jgi:hypothetical protein